MATEKHPCPKCGDERGMMINSRPSSFEGVLRRRRYNCGGCGYRWTTHEVEVSDTPGHMSHPQQNAFLFMHELEKLTREYFGDEYGSFAGIRGRR